MKLFKLRCSAVKVFKMNFKVTESIVLPLHCLLRVCMLPKRIQNKKYIKSGKWTFADVVQH